MNKFYLWKVDDRFITVNDKTLKLGLTQHTKNAAVWSELKEAKSWLIKILPQYPTAEIVEAELVVKL